MDPATGKALFIVVNLGHNRFENYSIGVDRAARFKLGFDSEWSGFGGEGALQKSLHGSDVISMSSPAQNKPFSLTVPVVAPYSVSIFEQL